MILDAARRGLRRAGALWGLVLFLLAVNLLTAAVLAVPMAQTLREDLSNRAAADNMLYGFDYPWWAAWADAHPRTTFSPGHPRRRLRLQEPRPAPRRAICPPASSRSADPERTGEAEPAIDSTILALGAAYLLLQVFLGGGVLASLRAPQPDWTVRGVLHASGFYFGRLLRLSLLVLLVDAVLFWLYVPLARWADDHAREAVSERTAMVWMLGRHLLLLLALLAVSMVSSYARTLIVLEERSSAVLAFALRGRALPRQLRPDLRARAPHDRADGGRARPLDRARPALGDDRLQDAARHPRAARRARVPAHLPPRGHGGRTGDPGAAPVRRTGGGRHEPAPPAPSTPRRPSGRRWPSSRAASPWSRPAMPAGEPLGLTVSAFCSVSLSPPLVLVSVDVGSEAHAGFRDSGVFGVSILAEGQDDVSRLFARPGPREVPRGARCTTGQRGVALVPGALAHIECEVRAAHPAGDHILYVGEIVALAVRPGRPLLYNRGGYRRLADDAVSERARVSGAVQHGLVLPRPQRRGGPGRQALPATGATRPSPTARCRRAANRLGNALRALGVGAEDRVLIVLPDRPEFAFAWFGAAKIGAVIAMVNPLLPAEDYLHYFEYTRAKVAIVESSTLERLDPVRERFTHLRHLLVVGEPGAAPLLRRGLRGGLRPIDQRRHAPRRSGHLALHERLDGQAEGGRPPPAGPALEHRALRDAGDGHPRGRPDRQRAQALLRLRDGHQPALPVRGRRRHRPLQRAQRARRRSSTSSSGTGRRSSPRCRR